MNNVFLKFEQKSSLSALLLGYALKTENWSAPNGLIMTAVPDMMLNFDPFLNNLKQVFNGKAVILKMNPNSICRFHIDGIRLASINLLLDGFDSNFYFSTPGSTANLIENVVEAKYEPDTYYLVNSKEKHSVINKSETRYLLSVEFTEHDFATIRDYSIENMFIK
jgi:hypothetical protein